MLGLYCTAYLPKEFDPNFYDDEEDDEEDEDYEPEFKTELDFNDCYCTYIQRNRRKFRLFTRKCG